MIYQTGLYLKKQMKLVYQSYAFNLRTPPLMVELKMFNQQKENLIQFGLDGIFEPKDTELQKIGRGKRKQVILPSGNKLNPNTR